MHVGEESEFQFYVEEVSCTPVGSDPTGLLSSAYAIISGLLAPAFLLYPNPESQHSIYDFQLLTESGLLLPFWADHLLDDPGDGHMEAYSTLYILNCNVHRGFYTFLVLKKVEDSSIAVYERVGVVCNAQQGRGHKFWGGWETFKLV